MSEPNPRSLVGRENLPPPVRFESRRKQRPARPASGYGAYARTEALHPDDAPTNIRDNGAISDIDSVLSLLLNDQRPEDTMMNIPNSLNELE